MALITKNKTFDDTYEYTPVDQRDEAKPFSVVFKRIPLDVLAVLQDESVALNQSGTYTINVNSQYLKALKYALVDWKNVNDGKKDIKFRIVHGEASDESLEILPPELRAEIAAIIIEVSKDPANADVILGNEDGSK
jgi:predicted PilT family ATPase